MAQIALRFAVVCPDEPSCLAFTRSRPGPDGCDLHHGRRRHRHGRVPQGSRDDVQRRVARPGAPRLGGCRRAVDRRFADLRGARRDDAGGRRRIRVRARGVRPVLGLRLRLDALLHRGSGRRRGAGGGPRHLQQRRRWRSAGGAPRELREPDDQRRDARGDGRHRRRHADQLRGGRGRRTGRVDDGRREDCVDFRPGRRGVDARRGQLGSLRAIGRAGPLRGSAGRGARRDRWVRRGDVRGALGVQRLERDELHRRRGERTRSATCRSPSSPASASSWRSTAS